jgi:glycosyltransferase involved in cell wall biosynthesis
MAEDARSRERLGVKRFRVAIVCPDAFTAWHFYKPLLTGLQAHGCEVWVISRPGIDVQNLERLGIGHVPLMVGRFISLWKDIRGLAHLILTMRKYRFDFVHSFYLKLNAYGALAARMSGAKRVLGTVEGLGFTHDSGGGFVAALLRLIINQFNRLTGRLSDKIWFVNDSDRDLFVSRGFVGKSKTLVTRGHGIDLRDFDQRRSDPEKLEALRNELGLTTSSVAVTMIVARAIWSKGIQEFVDMASLLRHRNPHVRFILLAPPEADSPDVVPNSYLESAVSANPNLCWLSQFRRDILDILDLSDVVVLQSYYNEGFPAVLLEAMALGKPIVTTQNVGCQDAVVHGDNGYLVPARNPKRLANAVEELLNDPGKREVFGKRSRKKAEEKCDASIVIQQVLDSLYSKPLSIRKSD